MYFFISHSSADADIAMQLCEFLEGNQIECFIAPRDIRSGREYAEEIVNGIDRSTAMVLLMSDRANRSPHVLREVERAVSKNIPLLVYKLEDVVLSKSLEYFLMAHQWVNVEKQGDFSEVMRFAGELEKGRAGSAAGMGEAPAIREDGQGAAIQKDEQGDAGAGTGRPGGRFRRLWAAGAALAALLIVLGLGAAGILHFGERGGTVAQVPDLQPGDTVTFGSYNGEPIQWRVLRLEEADGEPAAVLVSRYILTMKAFDAAESGKYNHDENTDYIGRESAADRDLELQAYVRGSSDWSTSNIRAWLNAETELVPYEGQAPIASAMSEHQNGYQNEPGFLYGFTQEERAFLVERENHTAGNALAAGEDIVTGDRVFLLSMEELVWFDEAGMSRLARPTQAALEQDTSQWYEVSVSECGVEEYGWWLRSPAEEYSSKAYLVENGYGIENEDVSNNIRKANVGLEGYGIRPAVMVRLAGLASQPPA